MRELYFSCTSGASGDMLAGALLELFEDREEILRRLNGIGIPGIEYSAESMVKYSIAGTRLCVSYLGKEEEQGMCDHHHCHSSLADIQNIISGLSMDDKLKEDVRSVYKIIAGAESAVHNCEMEHIHFHELGSMDAVADITAVCYMCEQLHVGRITSSPLCTGFGEVSCAHGVLPVPAPATARIIETIPSFAGDMEGELCTPTGAALIRHLASGFGPRPMMTVIRSGFGFGKKNFPKLSAVQAFLGETEETIIELCCSVDDMTPEAVGFAIDELLRHGAPDACYEAIGMKKNRPGILLTCLCREEQRDEMVRLIFKHTSTIGIRETLCRRYVLRREEKTVETPYGPVRIKLSGGYGAEKKKAEFDDLAEIARREDIPLSRIREIAESDDQDHILLQ